MKLNNQQINALVDLAAIKLHDRLARNKKDIEAKIKVTLTAKEKKEALNSALKKKTSAKVEEEVVKRGFRKGAYNSYGVNRSYIANQIHLATVGSEDYKMLVNMLAKTLDVDL